MEIHDGTKRFQAAGLGVVCHGDAAAGGDIQKAETVQLPQSLVDHGLADLHLIGQLTLSGQPVPRAQFAGEDHALQLLDEQLLDGRGDDLTKGHSSCSFAFFSGPTRTI